MTRSATGVRFPTESELLRVIGELRDESRKTREAIYELREAVMANTEAMERSTRCSGERQLPADRNSSP